MKAEMQEDYDKASKILDTILDEDDANNQAKKRKIAIIKVKNEILKGLRWFNANVPLITCAYRELLIEVYLWRGCPWRGYVN